MEQKCPQHELQITFKWKDAFDKGGSFLMSSNTLSLTSIVYERCCVLFNIAAIKSQIGSMLANEGINNDVALKLAAKHFQSAAGIFLALRHLTPTIGQDITPDLNSDVLNVLHTIMLAQAQELFFFKASNDNMKDNIIARVASQCEEYYMDALKHLPILKLAGIEKDWSSIFSMKQSVFTGIAEFHQANVCQSKKDFGQVVARSQKADECLKLAQSKGGMFFANVYKNFLARAQRVLEESKKDNDFIYHARVPEEKALEPIGKASLVQPTPLPTKFRPNIPDPFANLLPLAIQQATQKLESKKQELVHQETATLRELTQILNGVLASLNLPASLEDVIGTELPASIKEKAQFVRGQGGIDALDKLINELPNLLNRNKEILEVTEKMLEQEETTDNNYRAQFKEKWQRSPSSKLTGVFREHVTKYTNIIKNAMDADKKIQRKYADFKELIQLLSQDNSEIQKAIPSGSGNGSDLLSSPSAKELKSLMNEVEHLRREREELEENLKSAVFDDMKAKFSAALSANGSINEEALSVETIAEVYAPLQKQARDIKVKHESLIERIQRANEQFVNLKRMSNQGDSRREDFLSRLASAHDAFQELMTNIAEGTKFYNDLTTLLVNLQGKVDDLCFARKTEADELVKAIQNEIVSRPSPSPPSAPSYHSKPEDKPKPPRPPPPQISSAPAAQTAGATAPTPAAPTPSYPFNQPYPNPYQPYYYPPPPLPPTYSAYANPYAPHPPQQNPYPTQPQPGQPQPGQPQPPPSGYPPYPNPYSNPYPQYPR